jgi:immunity protein blpL
MIRYHLIVMEKAMKKIFATKRNVFLVRLLFGQIPLLVSTYLFLSRQFLNFSLVFQFLLVVINLTSILAVVYLTRKMRVKKFEDDDLVSPKTNQLMFIGLTGFMSIICLYRGITAGESYQQLIAYIGAVLCLLIMLLLIWGLKYYKK